MGFITKLQAINQMLLASGESPVADLLGSSSIDTEIANTILEQASLDFQLRGLANNKITKKFNPNSSGLILLPLPDNDEEGVLSAKLLSTHVNEDNDIIVCRVYNDGTGSYSSQKLYNFTDDTDIWELNKDYFVELIKKLSWSHLDTLSQRAIIATAVRHYQTITQGDSQLDSYLGQLEDIFRMKSKSADAYMKNRNIFNGAESTVFNSVYRNRANISKRFWQG